MSDGTGEKAIAKPTAFGKTVPAKLIPFVLDESQLTIDPVVLAQGSYGLVYRGCYKERTVCVKVRVCRSP